MKLEDQVIWAKLWRLALAFTTLVICHIEILPLLLLALDSSRSDVLVRSRCCVAGALNNESSGLPPDRVLFQRGDSGHAGLGLPGIVCVGTHESLSFVCVFLSSFLMRIS